MGILDDAIREHLELKRQLGADDLELKRLEDEAFGPPSRPGEPDFEPSAEDAAKSENGGAGGVAEAETTVAEVPPPAEEPEAAESQPAVEEPHEAEGPPEVEEPPELEEPSAAEHPVVEATEEPAEEPAAAGPEDPETAIYDHTSDAEIEFGELDLELDEDEEPLAEEAEGGAEPEGLDQPEEPAAESPPDAPIESLETVEHPFPDELTEDDEELPEEAAEPAEPAEPDEAEADEADEADSDQEKDDDVLADTPEFLKDAPEDDELWFEQGKPKDFDF